MIIRFPKKNRLNLGNLLSLGDKDSDMQVAIKAGVGVRCHYLAGAFGEIVPNVATHKIHSLRDGVSLLTELVATSENS